MDSQTYAASTAMLLCFALYLRFGTLAFWVIGVTGFMSAWFIMLVETFLHIALSEESFQSYRKTKRKYLQKYLKRSFFDIDNSGICKEHNISEIKLFVIMLLFFVGIIYLIYIIH